MVGARGTKRASPGIDSKDATSGRRYGVTVALRRFVHKLTKSVEEIDREKLEAFCTTYDLTAIAEVEPRDRARVGGEIKSVRIVPRAGAASVEATISDGRDSLTAVFLGRRRVGGVSTGRRLVVEGMVAKDGNRRMMFNPIYELH